jgi:hypothetical protein
VQRARDDIFHNTAAWRASVSESARKRARKQRDLGRLQTKVNIKEEFVRWNNLTQELGHQKHEQLAKYLIDL